LRFANASATVAHFMEYVLVLAGVGLLYGGGELLVKGAVSLSHILGLSPLVVGLTVVAFATSTPELASSLIAVARGSTDIAVGNVVGSNTANIGLILGAAALVDPITAHAKFLVREMPVLLGVSLLLALVIGDGVTRVEGLILVALIAPYIWLLLRDRELATVEAQFAEEYRSAPGRPLEATALVVGGIFLLVAGAGALIEGAVEMARSFGISERVIGVSLVAAGTSLPELATSVVAAMRREGDIALGNVVGSNVFNILAVLGITATVTPLAAVAESMTVDVLVMLGFTLLLAPLAISGQVINRWEGALLLVGYAAYITLLFARPA
jgi:cation:H+ antiporter